MTPGVHPLRVLTVREDDDDTRERDIAEIATLLRLCHADSVAELRREIETRIFNPGPDLRIAH